MAVAISSSATPRSRSRTASSRTLAGGQKRFGCSTPSAARSPRRLGRGEPDVRAALLVLGGRRPGADERAPGRLRAVEDRSDRLAVDPLRAPGELRVAHPRSRSIAAALLSWRSGAVNSWTSMVLLPTRPSSTGRIA